MQQIYFSGIVALFLSILHAAFPLFDKKYRDYSGVWVPFTGGIAIGYVFIYLLPKLSNYTQLIILKEPDGWELLHYRLYLIALLGLLIYLATDRYGTTTKEKFQKSIMIHSVGFCFYSLLIGILITNIPRPGIIPIFIAGILALGPHLLGTDHQLRNWHCQFFDKYLRWLLAISILLGWIIGTYLELPKQVLFYSTAFLAGGMITNAMVEEIPDQNKRMLPFFAGVGFFAFIGIIMRSISKVPL